jgi:uncharacterized protein YjiS (DUF1127 family)
MRFLGLGLGDALWEMSTGNEFRIGSRPAYGGLMTALAPIIVIFRAGVRKCSARLAAWQRQRQTYEAVMRCSDHLLTDMGIEREHVALIARGIDPRQHDASKSGWRGWWHGLRQQLDAARATRCERHRISRELMAYNDRNLDELGIRRSEIPALARRLAAEEPPLRSGTLSATAVPLPAVLRPVARLAGATFPLLS